MTNHLLTLLGVGALQTHHDRHVSEMLSGGNDGLGDHIAANDTCTRQTVRSSPFLPHGSFHVVLTSIDVDQYRVDILVAQDEFESLDHPGDICLTSAVQEIGTFPTEMSDGIIGGHRQTRAVHEAPDTALELDIHQPVLLGFELYRLFLRQVSKLENLALSVRCGIVDCQFGVGTHELAALAVLNQRIDLQKGGVALAEHSVQVGQQVLDLSVPLVAKFKFLANRRNNVIGYSFAVLQRHVDHFLWASRGKFFDAGTSTLAHEQDWCIVFATDGEGQVVFIRNVDFLRHVELVDWKTFGAGLLGDEFVSKHAGCKFLCF